MSTAPNPPPKRRKRNSSKVNLIVSAVFHAAVILALFFFAAREGMLGKKMKTLAAVMVKEKPPEKPKEKPPEPKVEPPKEQPKPVTPPKTAAATPATPPPAPAPVASVPVAAPPPSALPAFAFADGAKSVISTTNVTELYKGQIEYAFRSRWVRPEGLGDESFVAEVQVRIDPEGRVLSSEWKKGSGNARWDDSVRQAVAQTKAISRPPPRDFPSSFVVRFDVQSELEEEPQATIR